MKQVKSPSAKYKAVVRGIRRGKPAKVYVPVRHLLDRVERFCHLLAEIHREEVKDVAN